MAGKKEIEISVAEVVDYMRITGRFGPFLNEVVRRKVTAEEAKRIGLKVSTSELQKAADAFRVANGLNKTEDTEDWLNSNGISLETLEEFFKTSLLIHKFKDSLARKTGKKKYFSSQGIKESVREMAYEDWVTMVLK
jgi:hypothetical protein